MQAGWNPSNPTRWLAVRLLALMGLCGACAPPSPPPSLPAAESQAAGMAHAVEMQREGRYAEAVRSYREVVRDHPENALAHFELALLLQDFRQDEAGAIYHFRTYLDLLPGSEKAPVARERLLAAEQKLGRRFGGGETSSSARAVTDAQIVERLEELNAQVAQRDRTLQQKREEIATLTRDNERLAKEASSLSGRLDLMLAGTTAPRPPSTALRDRTLGLPEPAETPPRLSAAEPAPSPRPAPVPPRPLVARPGERTYRVQRGDSLWSIAQKVYGDPSRSSDIRNANQSRIGPNDRLTEGDELKIPFP